MINIKIKNEFSDLKIALIHNAENVISLDDNEWAKIVPKSILAKHPETGLINKDEFVKQQKTYIEFLIQSDVQLISPLTQSNAFCQVYTRDPCFVIDETLFIGKMKDKYRYPEIEGLKKIKNEIANIIEIDGNDVVIEGGDIFVFEDLILVGTGQITNQAGFDKLKSFIFRQYEVVQIPHFALHLDCCIAPLPNGMLLYSKKHLPKASIELLTRYFIVHLLDENEADNFLSANLLWINEKKVVSHSFSRKTNRFLRSCDFIIHEIDFTQPISMWGSVRCVTCPLLRE